MRLYKKINNEEKNVAIMIAGRNELVVMQTGRERELSNVWEFNIDTRKL